MGFVRKWIQALSVPVDETTGAIRVISDGGGGGVDPVGLKNSTGSAINPATEEKQNNIDQKLPALEQGKIPVNAGVPNLGQAPTGNSLPVVLPDSQEMNLLGGIVDKGVVTSSTNNTLTDSAKKWSGNLFSQGYIKITSGTGVNQMRAIGSNTTSAITIGGTWAVNPAAGDTYVIYGFANTYIANTMNSNLSNIYTTTGGIQVNTAGCTNQPNSERSAGPISTSGDDPVIALTELFIPRVAYRIINEGLNPGFFSVDGGMTWHRLPASSAGVPGIISARHYNQMQLSVQVKRVPGGGDLTNVFVSEW